MTDNTTIITKNKANTETIAFIEKMQNTLYDLVEESKTIEDIGMQYYCPFNKFLDMAEEFYCKEVDELIDEQNNNLFD